MRIIEAVFETNWAGAKACVLMEFEDDATDDEIDEAVGEWAANHYSWGWDDAADEKKR